LSAPGYYYYYRLSGQYAGTTSTGLVTFALFQSRYNANNRSISNVSDPILVQDAATKNYVDTSTVKKDGTVVMTGALNTGTNKITSVVDPSAAQDAATKNYVDLYVSVLSVFNVGTHGILLNTNAITLTTTATALTLTRSGTIFNPKSNIITLNNSTQVNLTSPATVNFMCATNMIVGAATGTMGLVVYDVTAANPAYSIAPTAASNTTTEYLLRCSFTSIGNHNYEFRVQITATGNIQCSSAGYMSYGY
jgi:hypothetical protein